MSLKRDISNNSFIENQKPAKNKTTRASKVAENNLESQGLTL